MVLTIRTASWTRISVAACRRFALAGGFAAAILWAGPASAVQHLIRPSDEWQSLGARLRPGDEIILMPGEHSGATIERLIGTHERPITIRGADPANPSTIIAEREGIRVALADHLVIKDLIITGAKVYGLNIGGSDLSELETGHPVRGKVVIRNVTVNRTGPRGQRHGILIRTLNNVRIEDCKITGWGGSAVEILTCENVVVARCTMTGLNDHGQANGVRVRGCSVSVEVEECRFENAGEIAVSMGAASKIDDLPPALLANASDGSLAEAARVTVQRCLIIGSACPLAFINSDDCMVRNNTIVRPKRTVFALLAEQADPRFSIGRNGVFGRNLIVWETGDLQRLAEIAPDKDWSRFALDASVWWSPETADQRAKLGALPGREILPQVFTVDPKLNTKYKPTTSEADGFGF